MDAVLYAAVNTAEDFQGGISGMAVAIGKNKFSLTHELSQTGSAKLGLKDAVKMMKRAGDFRVAHAIAAEIGHFMLPLPEAVPAGGDDTMRDLAVVTKEFAEVMQEVSVAAADGSITDNEMARAEREWAELVAAGVHMMSRLRARHEAAKPAHLKAA
jgi:hypothetical protein